MNVCFRRTLFVGLLWGTSPRTQSGRWLLGAAIVAGTMAMRYWSPLPEGTTIAILAFNAVVPQINRFTVSPLS
ncbi:MAG: RnfABCDGE type electron transport complex subunit D [Dethiobacter sp.]|nr:RnfABCDGE type electron transport complex subunit D [Dethiobacter sp.]MBS3897245.1 RnfABCDGE type electron transport complex subunit D [Dethiobacter sp.]MBS3983617.1 RnfABCDGE type electron transport complex subunit D [Dethiobacter sp.]